MAASHTPKFHNDKGVPAIDIGVHEFECIGALAALRSSPCLYRHGR